MSKLLPTSAALLALVLLSGCVDVGDIPNLGGTTAYQRSIDQDVSSSFDEGATTRTLSPRSPGSTRFDTR